MPLYITFKKGPLAGQTISSDDPIFIAAHEIARAKFLAQSECFCENQGVCDYCQADNKADEAWLDERTRSISKGT